MTSGNRMLLPRRQETLSKGGGLEDHLRLRVHVPAGRGSVVPFTNRAGPNANGSRFEFAGRSFSRSAGRRSVRRIGPWKARSRCYPALSARSHRPRLEAKSWAAALEHRHSLRSRTALGAIKRTLATRDIVAVRGGFENQSERVGSYESGSHYYPAVGSPFFFF